MMNRKTSGNIRGYLFNVMIRQLLTKSGYALIRPNAQNNRQVRRVRNDVIELRGRGCWHPVDCPCIGERTAPFEIPVRLIGQVRYHMSEIKKESVRNFIGILADLREGSFLMDGQDGGAVLPPRTDVGVMFAANGFWPEAERLALTHGIRTISYKNNLQMEALKNLIFELESRYLDYDVVMQQGNFLAQFTQVICRELPADQFAQMYNLAGETVPLMKHMTEELERIRTSFFASTATGVMMHFLGAEDFPGELFSKTDTALCQVRMEVSGAGLRAYYLQFDGDTRQRKYYFAPPEGFSGQVLYGWDQKKGEGKEQTLYVSTEIEGMQRSLKLLMSPDWRSALTF